MTLPTGARLGPYEILGPLGAGGMGEVYRARDTRLDRTVAVKVLPETLAGNAQLRLRFEREAKAISALAHPNICTLHDVGTHDGIDFLVMEHLEGETLAERIGRGPLPVSEALKIGMEICDALDRAHRGGIIHRDLKPGNVMLTKSGAKLLDFGLARSVETEAVGANSMTACVLFSPHMMRTPVELDNSIAGPMGSRGDFLTRVTQTITNYQSPPSHELAGVRVPRRTHVDFAADRRTDISNSELPHDCSGTCHRRKEREGSSSGRAGVLSHQGRLPSPAQDQIRRK